MRNLTIVGYYTLVVGQVEYSDAPERLTKGLARHPVPIMLLARLAIAVSWQGNGFRRRVASSGSVGGHRGRGKEACC